MVDRPEAVESATKRIQTLGLQNRCEIRAGDLLEGVPGDVHTYLMRNVLHGYESQSAVTRSQSRSRICSMISVDRCASGANSVLISSLDFSPGFLS